VSILHDDKTRARLLLSLPVALALAALALFTFVDPDLWGHTRFGLDILRDHRLPTVDPYSFTQDVPWVNHEWLHEAISALAYLVAGNAGLIMLKAVLVLATIGVIGSAIAAAALPVQWVVMAMTIVGLMPLLVTIRPQLWTGLFIAILCKILVARRGFWLLPLLFFAWANLHGGWIVGAGVLVAWAATTWLFDRPGLSGPIIGVLLASAFATLLTPYGFTLWRFLSTTANGPRDIAEWLPLWTKPVTFWGPWLLSFGGAMAAVWRSRRSAKGSLAILLILGAGAVWISRIVSLSVIANAVVAGPALAQVFPIRSGERRLAGWTAPTVFGGCLAVIALALFPSSRCLPIVGPWTADGPAAESLRRGGARGRLVTEFGWGEYAIWHLAPALKVSIDGRRETVYTDTTVGEQIGIEEGSAEGLQALARIRPEYVWLRADAAGATREWLKGNDYRIDIDRPRSFIAVRRDLPHMEVAPTVETGCFPGP
jgi:hypothetical protein